MKRFWFEVGIGGIVIGGIGISRRWFTAGGSLFGVGTVLLIIGGVGISERWFMVGGSLFGVGTVGFTDWLGIGRDWFTVVIGFWLMISLIREL